MTSLIIVTDEEVLITSNIPNDRALELGMKHGQRTGDPRWNVVASDAPVVIVHGEQVWPAKSGR